MNEQPEDDVAKIARLAARRGYWDDRKALEGAAMARLHHEGPRLFLKKLLERTCGLTYDEVARLEKDALAPPPAKTPTRSLPRLGGRPPGGPAAEAPPPQQIVSPAKLPRLDEPRPAAPPPHAPEPGPTAEPAPVVQKRPLPRLNAPRKPREEPPAPGPAPG